MQKAVITLLALFLIICAWLAWIAFQPPLGRPDISLSFFGKTNSTSGEQFSFFMVTNQSSSDVYIGGGWTSLKSEINTDKWVRVTEPFWLHTTLQRGASTNFLIPTPTNQVEWKYAFDARNDIGFEQDVWYALTRKLRPKDYVFESQWIDFKR